MEGFWYAFEKRAMTNKKIMKRYIENLLSVMKKSSDPTDRAVHKYISTKVNGLEPKLTKKLRDIGESPSLGWIHNVDPKSMKRMVHEANIKKHRPGWARTQVLKTLGG